MSHTRLIGFAALGSVGLLAAACGPAVLDDAKLQDAISTGLRPADEPRGPVCRLSRRPEDRHGGHVQLHVDGRRWDEVHDRGHADRRPGQRPLVSSAAKRQSRGQSRGQLTSRRVGAGRRRPAQDLRRAVRFHRLIAIPDIGTFAISLQSREANDRFRGSTDRRAISPERGEQFVRCAVRIDLVSGYAPQDCLGRLAMLGVTQPFS